MNGIHDLGGMQGFGPVEREENEPVFHADWERHIFALAQSDDSRRAVSRRRNPPFDRANAAGGISNNAVLRALAPCRGGSPRQEGGGDSCGA